MNTGSVRDQLLAEQRAYYSSLAPDYLDQGLDLPGGGELADALDAFRPEGSVLELACGPGTWTPQLLRHAADATAVDASPEMLAIAAGRVPGGAPVRFVEADLKHYAGAYGDPGRLRSAFEFYRAIPAGIPLLLADGEHVFGPVLPALAGNLRAGYGWSDIEVRIVAVGRHYLAEERPADIAELIERHAAGRQVHSPPGRAGCSAAATVSGPARQPHGSTGRDRACCRRNQGDSGLSQPAGAFQRRTHRGLGAPGRCSPRGGTVPLR